MSLENLFILLAAHPSEIFLALLLAPWLTGLICWIIPGRREEPWLLSVNLWLAVISLLLWVGYLAYASNTGGWSLVVKQANILLLLAPPYYAIASLLISRQLLPLSSIPAFRTLQGLVVMGAVYFAIAALFSRIRIYFFSYLPFSTFLWCLALLLGLGYWGYCQFIGDTSHRRASRRSWPDSQGSSNNQRTTASSGSKNASIDDELERLRHDLGLNTIRRPPRS